MYKLKGYFLVCLSAAVFMLPACKTTRKMNNKQKGATVGAASGAAVGGIIGNNVGKKSNTVLGALIGAVVGGVAGGLIGDKMDKQADAIKNEVPGAQVTRVEEGINVTFDEKNPDGSAAGVFFSTNQYNITDNSKLALGKLVKIFNQYPETNILIEGHTDNVGTSSYNLSLSQRRADAVGDYLKAQGISANRLTIKWYGETQPKADNSTEAGRASNRRVEFAVTANDKMKAEAKQQASQKN
jgi:outer membrane protein OmpA-like peptidoglycan-associated protein